jgi:hypothetical protein
MRITRSKLIEMIEQEVRAAIVEKGSSKKGKKPDQQTADQEPAKVTPPGGGPDPIQSAPPIDGGMNDTDGEPDPVSPDDPTDGQGPDDAEALDADGTGGEKPSGAVNKEVSGKTVQAISIEPKGVNLAGSKEVVLTFNETQDSLRIIVTETGQVKFGWPCGPDGKAKQLHDLP